MGKRRVNSARFERLKDIINMTEVARRTFPDKTRSWFTQLMNKTYGKGFTKEQMIMIKVNLREIAKEIEQIAGEL